MDPDKAEYRISEAARVKGVQRSTVWRAVSSGELAAHTVQVSPARSVWVILREDLEAWHPVVSPAERGRRGAAARYGKGDPE